jgi:predicted GNAT family acetyltransferase
MAEDDPSIELEQSPTGGAYRLRKNDHVAELTFSRTSPTLIIVDHTEVPAALRGQKIGERLVAKVVADARAAGAKIFPLCPYAASQFRRHPDYADVLSK